MYQQNKSSESKVKFRQASNHCKRVLEAAKLAYATKTKESITSQKLGSRDFWRIANSVLNKGKSAIPPLFNRLEVLSSASDKAKLFTKNFYFLSNRWLQVVLDGKSSQEYPVNAGVPQGSILGPRLFLLYINDLPDDVICNIAICADDTSLL